jgi:hypothetical protein
MAHLSRRCNHEKTSIACGIDCHRNNCIGRNDVVDTQMSDYMEIINPQTRTAKLMFQGKIIEEYKIEQCDKCSKLMKFDQFGYQKGYGGENIIWFCGGCR